MRIQLNCLSLGLLAAMLVSTGCRLAESTQAPRWMHHHELCHQIPQGTVSTGGVFAHRRSLQIPASGLTLSAAVEASLRPGLRQPVFVLPHGGVRNKITPAQKGFPLISSVELLTECKTLFISVSQPSEARSALGPKVSKFHNAPISARNAIREFLLSEKSFDVVKGFEGPQASSDDEVMLDRLLQIMKMTNEKITISNLSEELTAIKNTFDNFLSDPGIPLNQATIEQAFQQAVPNALAREAISAWMIAHQDVLSDLEQRNNVLKRVQALALAESASVANSSASPDDVSGEDSSGSQVVAQSDVQALVLLKRAGDSTRIIPLSLVLSTPVGDIALTDRDHVEVNPFARTKVGSRVHEGNSSGYISLSGILSGELDLATFRNLADVSNLIQQQQLGPLVDVMVLETASEDGGVDEYWFPRSAATALNAYGGFDLSSVKLDVSDAIQVSTIELTPIVTRSRLIQRIEQIEQEQSTRFQQLMEEKAAREEQLLGSVRGNAVFQAVSRNLKRISFINW